MKTLNKLFYFVSSISLVFTLSACLGGLKVEHPCQDEFDDIHEACREGDFEKAHDIYDSLNPYLRGDITYDLYSSEVEYLVAQNDNSSSDRVIFLINEFAKEDDQPKGKLTKLALELAYDQGNAYLVRKLLGISGEWNQNAVISLVKQSDDESREAVVDLLSKLGDFATPSVGEEIPNNRVEEITEFNSKCKFVLDQAIIYKNEKLARAVINIFKPNIEGYYEVESCTYKDKEAAQKKLDDAIKNGTFAE